MGDIILYALYPVTGKKFLMYKYGKEVPPDDLKPRTLEQVKAEAELIAKAKAGKLVEVKEKPAPEKTPQARTFNVYVENEYFEVCVDEQGCPTITNYLQPPTAPQPPQPVVRPAVSIPAPSMPVPPRPMPSAPPAPKAPAPTAPVSKSPAPAAKASVDTDGTPVKAPMPGMIVNIVKKVGDPVKAGETVVVLEAMKMENAIHCKVGESVAKNAVLAVIG
jgi:biotin carboxyl carrier protein